ncbi:2-dehydropantoate 2-reductase [Variovorax dokdonensis]|uniref:2-dehydropantoate 2-reductase n=1 Tax=Variovorax dokdonensis TaxID=344883 RepID=A0ABT7N6D9_9BURK|nr:2-dehydropantoate 2-reductase [Variovorax dokdonensis]MDM0043513.1 2-dehydropantoate 2-reductase [Variovorax dokdonensis]
MTRFLMVGAGALGGYFGGRLLQAGEDVTFLVRARRAQQLRQTGLVIRSAFGDATIEHPPLVRSEDIDGHYDVVIVGCKAYDLPATIESFAPAVGPGTVIIPVLNGLRHLDELGRRFGADRVLGGLCMISAVLDDAGRVIHLNDLHALNFGETGGGRSARVDAIGQAFARANFQHHVSEDILQAMWEKWVFIASLAGMTCLMRASVGDIVQAGGKDIAARLVDECAAIAAHQGHAPSSAALARNKAALASAGSTLTASMLKDMERGLRIEADQIISDLLRRAPESASFDTLRTVQAHLLAYEARRARESKEGAGQ